MRRDDRQLWERVAETVERAGPAQDTRVPVGAAGELMARLRTDARAGTAAPPARASLAAGANTGASAPRASDERGRMRPGRPSRAQPHAPPVARERPPDAGALARLRARWAGGAGAANGAGSEPPVPPGPAGDRTAGGVRAATGFHAVGLGSAAPHFAGAEPDAPRLDRHAAKRLSRGREGIDRRVDLHGLTEADAHRRLLAFLAGARSDGLRHVLVITGKGAARRGGEGVLKRAVPRWLATPPFSPHVSGIAPAARHDGGEGALYVRLRR